MAKKKPITQKQKKIVEEAARRFAEILIAELEWKKNKKTRNNSQ